MLGLCQASLRCSLVPTLPSEGAVIMVIVRMRQPRHREIKHFPGVMQPASRTVELAPPEPPLTCPASPAERELLQLRTVG